MAFSRCGTGRRSSRGWCRCRLGWRAGGRVRVDAPDRQDLAVGIEDGDAVGAHQPKPPLRRALRQRCPVRTEQHQVVHGIAKLLFLLLRQDAAQPLWGREADVQQREARSRRPQTAIARPDWSRRPGETGDQKDEDDRGIAARVRPQPGALDRRP